MTVYYTTVVKVASLLNLITSGARKVFSSSTIPTDTEIEEIISRKEDEIDFRTGHAWRARTVTDEPHSPGFTYRSDAGVAVYLNHRKIISVTSLEIWNGSEWEEWVGSKTEGRASDYWLDYASGILYLKQSVSWSSRESTIRIDYTYGDTTVPGDIEDACTKMTAIDLLAGESRSIHLPEGTSKMSTGGIVDRWTADINRTLSRRAEWKTPSK